MIIALLWCRHLSVHTSSKRMPNECKAHQRGRNHTSLFVPFECIATKDVAYFSSMVSAWASGSWNWAHSAGDPGSCWSGLDRQPEQAFLGFHVFSIIANHCALQAFSVVVVHQVP